MGGGSNAIKVTKTSGSEGREWPRYDLMLVEEHSLRLLRRPPTPAAKVQNRVLQHQRDVFLKFGSCMGGGKSAALGHGKRVRLPSVGSSGV
jgi:hypothetical protein